MGQKKVDSGNSVFEPGIFSDDPAQMPRAQSLRTACCQFLQGSEAIIFVIKKIDHTILGSQDRT